MRKLALLIALVLGLSSCATIKIGEKGLDYRQQQGQKLQAAIMLHREGKITSAVEAYKGICSEKGLEGVTDQALFMLSLIYLDFGLGSDREFIQVAQQHLDRLRKEYPSSPWSSLTSPVVQMLESSAELRRQNINIKNQNQALSKENQSLSKENQELRQSIEKLKRLDLELEQKRK
jgi:hypothetical protein